MIPGSLLRFIREYDRYLILGHRDPDADCLCSQRAMGLYLRRSGKEALLFSPGPFTRTEIEHMESFFRVEIRDEDIQQGKTAVLIMDCSTLERIGPLAESIAGLPLAVIDHHASGEPFGTISWIRPEYPSTTLLVQEIIEKASGASVTGDEAELLFFGFSTDTGFFRHLEKESSYFISRAAGLVKAGASPKRAYQAMTDGRNLGSRRLLGRILDRTESLAEGKILLSWECLADRKELNTDDRDSDNLYQLLLSVKNCEAVAIVREESEVRCTIGLRAKNLIDVGRIAGEFGGGGHKKASGFTREGTIEQVKTELTTRLLKEV